MQEKFKREFKKRCLLCRVGFHDSPEFGDKTCHSTHTRASSIRSTAASSMRVKYHLNSYGGSNNSSAATPTTAMTTATALSNRNLGSNKSFHHHHHPASWQRADQRQLNGNFNNENHHHYAVYQPTTRTNKQQYRQEFETALVDNNNKYLCDYDDDFDRL